MDLTAQNTAIESLRRASPGSLLTRLRIPMSGVVALACYAIDLYVPGGRRSR
jgi:hypothetical protein